MAYPLIYAQWLKELENGKFQGLKCGACKSVCFPPRAVCGECGATDLSITEIDREGSIQTYTVIRVPPLGFTAPFVVVMVALDQGPRVVGNLLGVHAGQVSTDMIGRRVVMNSRAVPAGMFAGGETRALTFELKSPYIREEESDHAV